MRAFSDLLETVTPAAATTAARSLTTTASVKTALKITSTDATRDALIDALIPRVTQDIVDWCRLARDGAGTAPTFGSETLRATFRTTSGYRGAELFLPWRLPVSSITSVVEDGVTLSAGTDYVLKGAMAGRIERLSDSAAIEWSTAKIVVVFVAGYSVSTSLATNIDPAIEAAAIEQVKGQLFGADRDPTIRSENVPDVAAISYSVPGGDVMGAEVLLPAVRSRLARFRNTTP